MLVTNTEQNLGERTKHMDRKFTFMTQGNFPESHLAEPYQFVLQCISLQEDQKSRFTTIRSETSFYIL